MTLSYLNPKKGNMCSLKMYTRCHSDIHTFDLNSTEKRERDAQYSLPTFWFCCIFNCSWTLFGCSHCCRILTWTIEVKNTWASCSLCSATQSEWYKSGNQWTACQILTWGLRPKGKHPHASSVNISGLTRKWSRPWCVNVMRCLKGHTGWAVGLLRLRICDALTLKQPLHSLCAPSKCRHRAGKSHRITVTVFRPWWRYYESNHHCNYCDVPVFCSPKTFKKKTLSCKYSLLITDR